MLTRGEKVSAGILAFSVGFTGFVGGDAAINESRATIAAGSWAYKHGEAVVGAIQSVASDNDSHEQPSSDYAHALPTAPSQTPSGESSPTAPSSAPSSSESSSTGGERQKAPVVGTLVGDSITYGYYPTFLMEQLQKDGYKIRLVGDTKNVGEPSYPNCGHGGKNTKWITRNLKNCLDSTVNFAVVMAGTNNMNQDPAASLEDMRDLLREAYRLNPNATVFLCSIPPMLRSVDRPDTVTAYNRGLQQLSGEDEFRGKHITYIDANAAITGGWTDLSDGVHPTPDAAKKIANRMLPALKDYVKSLQK